MSPPRPLLTSLIARPTNGFQPHLRVFVGGGNLQPFERLWHAIVPGADTRTATART